MMLFSIEYFEHLFGDFLEGGKFGGDSVHGVWKVTQCAPSTNRAVESGFGFVDRLFSTSPNMSRARQEAKLMLKTNRTLDWLMSLPAHERENTIEESRALVGSLRREAREDKERLKIEILARIHKRRREVAVKEAMAVQRRSKAAKEVSEWGFWTTPHEADLKLSSLSSTEKIRALVSQLRFRERVVRQRRPEPRVFVLSSGGKPLGVEELRRRLLLLLEADSRGERTVS